MYDAQYNLCQESQRRHPEVGIDVTGLLFDDESEAKFARHGIAVSDVLEVFEKWPRYYRNRPDRRATHVMVGPTLRGRVLVVPIEPWGAEGLWRPVTAFPATPGQVSRYRSRR
jgi:hypothetical protein